MSAITYIGTVILPVADQDAALAFYTGTLGFEVRIDGETPGGRWLEVAPAGAQTSLALVDAEAMAVSFATDDADAARAALAESGADVDAEVMRWGEGVPPLFTFRAPDGHPFRVVERS